MSSINGLGLLENYDRELFRTRIPQGFISDIRRCTNSGVAFAGEKFISEIESLKLGRVSARASGRPRSV
jgi:hypothetical protein